MELSKNIVKKYNKLYIEVVKYYNLEDKIIINSIPLHYILIKDFGYNFGEKGLGNILSHMENNFIYLLPFYKLLHQEDSCSHISVSELLVEINEVMKKMRKENLVKAE